MIVFFKNASQFFFLPAIGLVWDDNNDLFIVLTFLIFGLSIRIFHEQ